MALSKKDFVSEANRLRRMRPAQRQVEMRTASRIFRKSNPRFSESRFKDYVKYGTENQREIAKLKKKPKKKVIRKRGKLWSVKKRKR